MAINSFNQVWRIPLALAALTIFGLLAALLGTGIWHLLSWIALGIPIITVIVFVFRFKKKNTDRAYN